MGLCASGGKDGVAKLWDLNRGESLYELACNEVINQLAFSPNRYWLCAATEKMIHIWDLKSKSTIAELTAPQAEGGRPPLRSASPSRGPLTAARCSLVSPTALCAFGTSRTSKRHPP